MKITKAVLPCHVTAGDRFIEIHHEHWYWLMFDEVLRRESVTIDDIRFIFVNDDYVGIDVNILFPALIDFYRQPAQIPRDMGSGGKRLIDYTLDADLIYAGFLQCYGVDIIDTPIHWHKFLSMLRGLHGTALNDVMGYRAYTGKDKEMIKARNAWALPELDEEADVQARDEWARIFG